MPRDELEQRGVFSETDNTEDCMEEPRKEIKRRPNRIGRKSMGQRVADLGINGSSLAGAAVTLLKKVQAEEKVLAADKEALRSILRAEAKK
jgi:hypothetical protein